MDRLCIAAALLAAFVVASAAPASAQGEVLITQAKANAGNVTPGDGAGFPIVISRPGAYILGSNLQVPAGKIGLYVLAHNVDIDMNGFRLLGANGSGTPVATYGLYSTFGQSRIHDGVITQFQFHGIYLLGNVNAWRVENMQIIQNGRDGINAFESHYARFLNNSIVANGDDGIDCGLYCHVEGSTVSGNGGVGIVLYSGSVIGNTIMGNANTGVSDVTAEEDTGIGNNTIAGNAGGLAQTFNTLPMAPNACLPSPCN